MIKFRNSKLNEQITHIDPIANIDVSLSNIAGGAGVYVRIGKGSRCCGQSNNDNSGANSYAYNANVRDEVKNLARRCFKWVERPALRLR